MEVKPNLVVGAIGAVVFLLSGTLILTQWRELADIHTYDVAVTGAHQPLGQRSGEVRSGGTVSVLYGVAHHNVTHVLARVTWDDDSLTAQHEVTVTLLSPDGKVVDSDVSTGGVAGITLEKTLLSVPSPSRFDASSQAATTTFEDRYPDHPESAGAWILVISANTPSGVGSRPSVSYRATMDVDYYVATLTTAPSLGGVK